MIFMCECCGSVYDTILVTVDTKCPTCDTRGRIKLLEVGTKIEIAPPKLKIVPPQKKEEKKPASQTRELLAGLDGLFRCSQCKRIGACKDEAGYAHCPDCHALINSDALLFHSERVERFEAFVRTMTYYKEQGYLAQFVEKSFDEFMEANP